MFEGIFTGINACALPVFCAILIAREFFTWKENKHLKYILTPLVLISVIFAASNYLCGSDGNLYIRFIFFGLISSLVADILLMIIEVRLLLYGLVFFLVAHLLYICGFSTRYEFKLWHPFLFAGLGVPLAIFFMIVRKKAGKMAIAVLIYMIIITTMVFIAIAGMQNGSGYRGYLAASGAVLFLISDIILAVNEFVRDIPHSSVVVWAFYAPGQMLLALSCG